MKLNISKERFQAHADKEGDSEVGAVPPHTEDGWGRDIPLCPFCASPAKVRRVNYIHPEGKFFSYAVRCENPKCWVKPDTYDTDHPARSKDEAWKRWLGVK